MVLVLNNTRYGNCKVSIYQYEVSGGGHSYQNSESGLREVLVYQEQWPIV